MAEEGSQACRKIPATMESTRMTIHGLRPPAPAVAQAAEVEEEE